MLRMKFELCVITHNMTSRSYFGKMNSILGSVVPLAMFYEQGHFRDAIPSGQHVLLATKTKIAYARLYLKTRLCYGRRKNIVK